jgi:hypothetical protein
MIHVQIAPAQPFVLRHKAQRWMGSCLAFFCRLAEKVQQRQKLGAIRVEIYRRRSSNHLIGFRPRLHAVRPGKGGIQGNPFHQSLRPEHLPGREMPRTHRAPEGIAQMAEHLVRRHFAPASLRGRLNLLRAFSYLLLVALVGQAFHNHLTQSYQECRAETARRRNLVIEQCSGGNWNRSRTY